MKASEIYDDELEQMKEFFQGSPTGQWDEEVLALIEFFQTYRNLHN